MPKWCLADSLVSGAPRVNGIDSMYMGENLRLAGFPQAVPMCSNLNMSAAVVNKLGKQRIKPWPDTVAGAQG